MWTTLHFHHPPACMAIFGCRHVTKWLLNNLASTWSHIIDRWTLQIWLVLWHCVLSELLCEPTETQEHSAKIQRQTLPKVPGCPAWHGQTDLAANAQKRTLGWNIRDPKCLVCNHSLVNEEIPYFDTILSYMHQIFDVARVYVCKFQRTKWLNIWICILLARDQSKPQRGCASVTPFRVAHASGDADVNLNATATRSRVWASHKVHMRPQRNHTAINHYLERACQSSEDSLWNSKNGAANRKNTGWRMGKTDVCDQCEANPDSMGNPDLFSSSLLTGPL